MPTGKIVLTYMGQTLRYGKDYTITWRNNKQPGENAQFQITGKGNFTGKLEFDNNPSFTIQPSSLDNITSITAADVRFRNRKENYRTTLTLVDSNGKKLSEGTDYVVTWPTDRISEEQLNEAGGELELQAEVRGIGYYEGETSVSVDYKMYRYNFSKVKVNVDTSCTYNGKDQIPNLTVTYGKSTVSEDDYEIVQYTSNRFAGTATLTLEGKNAFRGTKKVTFRIRRAVASDVLKWLKTAGETTN
jgi:hypothetical protein